jgi:hypothetical protein
VLDTVREEAAGSPTLAGGRGGRGGGPAARGLTQRWTRPRPGPGRPRAGRGPRGPGSPRARRRPGRPRPRSARRAPRPPGTPAAGDWASTVPGAASSVTSRCTSDSPAASSHPAARVTGTRPPPAPPPAPGRSAPGRSGRGRRPEVDDGRDLGRRREAVRQAPPLHVQDHLDQARVRPREAVTHPARSRHPTSTTAPTRPGQGLGRQGWSLARPGWNLARRYRAPGGGA